MSKIYEIESVLGSTDAIDIRIEVEKGEVLSFSVNYRILVNGKWHQVYRIDTAHGYLHEQRYWISVESIPLRLKEKLLRQPLQLKSAYQMVVMLM